MLSRDKYGAGNKHLLNPKFPTKCINYSLHKTIYFFLILGTVRIMRKGLPKSVTPRNNQIEKR